MKKSFKQLLLVSAVIGLIGFGLAHAQSENEATGGAARGNIDPQKNYRGSKNY